MITKRAFRLAFYEKTTLSHCSVGQSELAPRYPSIPMRSAQLGWAGLAPSFVRQFDKGLRTGKPLTRLARDTCPRATSLLWLTLQRNRSVAMESRMKPHVSQPAPSKGGMRPCVLSMKWNSQRAPWRNTRVRYLPSANYPSTVPFNRAEQWPFHRHPIVSHVNPEAVG